MKEPRVHTVRYACILCLALVIVVSGCSMPPSKTTVENVIARHFEAREYRIIKVDINEISSIPLGEKTYMGARAYTVEVPEMVLEMTHDVGEPWMYRKGQRVTFRNARIRIKKSEDQKVRWTVANVSGINLP